MKMHFSKTLVAAAVVGAMTSGISSTASAFEYALSHINVEGLAFTPNAATPQNFTFNLTNTATLTGFAPVITANSCSGTTASNNCASGGTAPFPSPGNVLDAPPAEIPAGIRGGNNNFNFVGPSAASYASSDSVIRTAQLVSGLTPTSVEAIAEVNVGLNGTATGNSEIQSNTTVSFTATGGGAFTLTFNADPDMRAAINSPPGVHSAQSNLNASFTFVSNTNDAIFISWTPQGTAGNDCTVSAAAAAAGITCVETADTQDLNRNLGTGTNPSDIDHSFEAGNVLTAFGISVGGIPVDTYSVALNTVTSANVVSQVQVVPEPASIALLGLGLMGMGVSLRRRIRK